ncbi:UDP-glucose 6-dehydrogenase [Orchesella cincta]|uniref:UDP-glucose 6-dehydrogenase n=1 Tax=Orchesella cincta TaxID=48709 RepID=A0A1D2MCD1_ORCCI|nr:UDP-glucose 6-dehydrogenase [Orchesella cincta]
MRSVFSSGISPKLPIYEPGLDEVVKEWSWKKLGRAADLKFVEACSRHIASLSSGRKLLWRKALFRSMLLTLSCTFSNLTHVLELNFKCFQTRVFGRGYCDQDLLNPDRILIGGETSPEGQQAIEELCWVYSHWAANAFLAQRISSINAISALCEATGADVSEVAQAVGMDSRIGPKFLQASVGFGGSCFKKDLLNLVYMRTALTCPKLLVIDYDEYQNRDFAGRIVAPVQHLLPTAFGNIRIRIQEKHWGYSRISCHLRLQVIYLEEGANLPQFMIQRLRHKQIMTDLTSPLVTDDPGPCS